MRRHYKYRPTAALGPPFRCKRIGKMLLMICRSVTNGLPKCNECAEKYLHLFREVFTLNHEIHCNRFATT